MRLIDADALQREYMQFHDGKRSVLVDVAPTIEPEIIRCKDCKWWDKYSDTHGYCLAAKHGYWSGHWEIIIRRTYDADWFCADAEKKEGEEE